ncbi:hypothetical protein [Lysobacter sp. D1-1-M9]|uniref:hypothetical protein n=1 Tax=Novilysobacter longmucuonensis TaxID=3098603 RepID=UPI002FC84132
MRLPSKRLPALAMLLCLLALAGCASMGTQGDLLERNQYAWSGAIRWGDFEGALNLVDPEYRQEHPITPLELRRYEQVQISSYRDVGSHNDAAAGTAMRDVEIGVVNRHTQTERAVRYRERWRWDEQAQTWWLTTGLPDLWDGE